MKVAHADCSLYEAEGKVKIEAVRRSERKREKKHQMKLYLKAAQTVTRSYFSRFWDGYRGEIIRHSVSFNVEPTITIGTLKTLLKPYRWIPKKNLLLFHSDKPLHDDFATLAECLVREKDTLLVCNGGSYPVECTYRGVTFYIPISSCLETVGDVMDKIHLVTGHHPEDLLMDFGYVRLDDENAHLVTLGMVPDNYKINVVRVTPKKEPEVEPTSFLPVKFLAQMRDLTCHTDNHMNIFVDHHVRLDRSCMSVQVKSTDTVDDLKEKIYSITLTLPKHRRGLVYCRRLLANGSMTLAEYGIKDHDVIQWCDDRSFEIIVRWASPNYQIHAEPPGVLIEVVCFDSLGDLKEKIEKKTSIPSKRQDLMLYGMSLDNDEWCLMDYGIIRNAIKFLMLNIKEEHSA